MTTVHGIELAVLPTVATLGVVALTVTPSEITAMMGAAAILIGALFTGVALIISTLRSTAKQMSDKVTENTALTEKVKTKADTIEMKVDGTASKAQEQIASLQKELLWMRERFSDQKQDAALLAQSKAAPTQVTVPVSSTSTAVNGAEESLEQINADTSAIKDNTAKTEQKIDGLKKDA